MFPSSKQWKKWSLPSKLTAIGAFIGGLGIVLSIVFFIVPYIKKTEKIGPDPQITNYKPSSVEGANFAQSVSFEPKQENELGDIHFLTFAYDSIFSISIPECKYEVALTALTARTVADKYSFQWNKKASLIYITSGANQVYALSKWQTYIQTYRWCFIYHFKTELLLVIIDGTNQQPEIVRGWIIKNAPNLYLNMEPIKNLKVDSDEAILIVLEDNPNLIMDSGAIICMHETLRFSSGPMWLIQYGGGYRIYAKSPIISQRNILYSTKDIESEIKIENVEIDDNIILKAISYNVTFYTPNGRINKLVKKEIGTMATLIEIMNSFTTTYNYDNCIELVFGVPVRAQTTSNEVLFAKANLSGPLFGTSDLRIKETHYKNNSIIYQGTAIYDIKTGLRKKTIPEMGKLKNDFYLIWPVRN